MSAWLKLDEHHEGGACTLTVAGELFSADAQELLSAIRRILIQGCRTLEVDLQGITYLDSSGVDALLAARRLALVAQAEFSVTNPSPATLRLLQVTSTTDLLLDR